MFSDVLVDLYYEIVKSIDPDYSYEEVYTPFEVIGLLAQINYVVMLSDFALPDGGYAISDEEMRSLALHRAKRDYYVNMKKTEEIEELYNEYETEAKTKSRATKHKQKTI